MNWKTKGEKGERIAIGELAKWDLDVAIPLSDNLPWDLVVCNKGKLFRVQVKSSEAGDDNRTDFNTSTNNWHSKTTKKYSKSDCDVMILCDYNSIYLLGPDDFANRRSFTIRHEPSKNGQKKGTNMHDDFVISKKRIREVFK